MAKVKIIRSLFKKIEKKFKGESHKIIDLLETLEDNPKKGKLLGSIGGVVIKELKYKNFRFYFITDGFKLKIIDESKLVDLLIRFIRMSDKKHQQQTINEIKEVLINIGVEGFGE
jgi:midasin (ATPase involved in ribosome maturation)